MRSQPGTVNRVYKLGADVVAATGHIVLFNLGRAVTDIRVSGGELFDDVLVDVSNCLVQGGENDSRRYPIRISSHAGVHILVQIRDHGEDVGGKTLMSRKMTSLFHVQRKFAVTQV